MSAGAIISGGAENKRRPLKVSQVSTLIEPLCGRWSNKAPAGQIFCGQPKNKRLAPKVGQLSVDCPFSHSQKKYTRPALLLAAVWSTCVNRVTKGRGGGEGERTFDYICMSIYGSIRK